MNWETFLGATLEKYDQWQAEGKQIQTAKVIPVSRSLEAHQWVMPSEQVFQHLRNSRSFALSPCRCRTLGRHCEAPVETCLTLNDFSDKWVEQGLARRVSLQEAEERLATAARAGLVHMTLFNPDQHLFAICSCCPCCCHDLQFLLKHNRKELVARSQYRAVFDSDKCLECGLCVERCVFGARVLGPEGVEHLAENCYGCGLCVAVCPQDAIELKRVPFSSDQWAPK